MVQPYAAPHVHEKLVLDYNEICKKMKITFHQGLVQQIDNESLLVTSSQGEQKLSYEPWRHLGFSSTKRHLGLLPGGQWLWLWRSLGLVSQDR